MKGVYDGYKRLDCGTKLTFFAGANTGSGFCGAYDDIADEGKLERVYIIKGGAGTGKSTLIRHTADTAIKNGFGVEYYLCGSDPYSYDCVVLDGRIAVLDGTSPHTRDMVYPGAASEIIDISKFWDKSRLEESRNDIAYHTECKKNLYSSAYRYLRAAETVDTEISALADGIILKNKLEQYINRFIKSLSKSPKNSNNTAAKKYCHAITMRGAFYLPTYESVAETVYCISDCYGTAPIFMRSLSDKLIFFGHKIILTLLPLSGYIAGIYLPDKSVYITVSPSDKAHKTINMERFITESLTPETRGSIRLSSKIAEACMNEAIRTLKEASVHHFALEEIYKSSMDFASLNNHTKTICTDITERLRK